MEEKTIRMGRIPNNDDVEQQGKTTNKLLLQSGEVTIQLGKV
jgi:hypothetical protein